MTYRNLVRFINWLVKLANAIRLIQCKKSGECLCIFCDNDKCKHRGIQIDELIEPIQMEVDINEESCK